VIPKTKEAVRDTLIASAFIAMGSLLPGSLLDKGFEAHIGGIALGIGIGWLIKSVIDHTKGVKKSES
jgi:membrane associated rhomboid family serine protease